MEMDARIIKQPSSTCNGPQRPSGTTLLLPISMFDLEMRFYIIFNSRKH